jgi:hypothetical protein
MYMAIMQIYLVAVPFTDPKRGFSLPGRRIQRGAPLDRFLVGDGTRRH